MTSIDNKMIIIWAAWGNKNFWEQC